MTAEKPKTVKKAIHGNPLKPQQITGWIDVAVEDGQFEPDTVVENGETVKLVKEKPSSLHKPQDVGIPAWQRRDVDPD